MPFAQLKEAAFGVFPPTVLSHEDAIYLPFPPSHITYRANLISAARVRGRAVLRERFSTDAFWADIEKYQCTAHAAARCDGELHSPTGLSNRSRRRCGGCR